jgi:hypothetical protein
MRRLRGLIVSSLVLTLVAVGPPPGTARPDGQMIWAAHISLAPTWFDPAETSGIITPFMVIYAAYFKGWSDKKYRGLIHGASGAFGNAATRIEAFVAGGGTYVWGTYVYGSEADIDGLFGEQATQIDPKRREATLHRIQQLVHEKAIVAPIWLNAGLSGLGPRVEESGIGLIPGFAWSGPYEEVKLKGK